MPFPSHYQKHSISQNMMVYYLGEYSEEIWRVAGKKHLLSNFTFLLKAPFWFSTIQLYISFLNKLSKNKNLSHFFNPVSYPNPIHHEILYWLYVSQIGPFLTTLLPPSPPEPGSCYLTHKWTAAVAFQAPVVCFHSEGTKCCCGLH